MLVYLLPLPPPITGCHGTSWKPKPSSIIAKRPDNIGRKDHVVPGSDNDIGELAISVPRMSAISKAISKIACFLRSVEVLQNGEAASPHLENENG
jgi:hypothetical protein